MSYKVKKGDTLSQIAKSKGVSLKSIMGANPNIKNANLIRPGQNIKIPGKSLPGATTKNPYANLSQTQMNMLNVKSPKQLQQNVSRAMTLAVERGGAQTKGKPNKKVLELTPAMFNKVKTIEAQLKKGETPPTSKMYANIMNKISSMFGPKTAMAKGRNQPRKKVGGGAAKKVKGMMGGGKMTKGMAGGGASKMTKGMSPGGKLRMVTNKAGKKVPFFAADGIGKMKGGGKMTKGMAGGGSANKKTKGMMGGGKMAKGMSRGGKVTKMRGGGLAVKGTNFRIR